MSLSGLCIIEIQGGSRKHGSVVWAVEFLALVLWLSLATPLDLHFCSGGHQVTVSCVPNWLLVPWKVTSINQMRSHCCTTPLTDSGPQPANQDSRLISSKSTIRNRRLNMSLFLQGGGNTNSQSQFQKFSISRLAHKATQTLHKEMSTYLTLIFPKLIQISWLHIRTWGLSTPIIAVQFLK